MLALVMAGGLTAQTVDFVVVSKELSYNQTDNSTAALATNPWSFRADIEGSSLSGIATPTLSSAGGTGSVAMTYDASDGDWLVGAQFSSQALLDAAYFNGSYGITVLSQSVSPISLTGDTYPTAPIATLSGGTIVGGVLTWNVSQALTITISGTGIDHMGVYVFANGGGYDGGTDNFGVTSQAFTVPAFSMTSGQNYTVELSFDDIVGGTNTTAFSGTGGMSATQFAGVYTAQTKFTIQAVPEPGSYALICGIAAFMGMIVRRGRIGRGIDSRRGAYRKAAHSLSGV